VIYTCYTHEVIKKGTLFPLQKRRDADSLKREFGKLRKLYKTAYARYTRSVAADTCFCGCGATGFWSTSDWSPQFVESRDAHEYNEHQGPKTNKAVALWHVTAMNEAVFNQKSTVVLPDHVRQRGKLSGEGTGGVSQGKYLSYK